MPDNERPTPTNEQILTALRSTGYLFEQEIANLLGGATTGWAFEDQDTGISREIDIFQSRSVYSFEGNRSNDLSRAIVGECKNYQWPWVAIEREWDSWKYARELQELEMSVPMQIRLGADHEARMSFGLRDDDANFYEASRRYGTKKFRGLSSS
jgi:hypothetical protein